MTVGEKIKQYREKRGMSQDELARRMGYKDRSSISKIEKSSDKNLSLEIVQKIADILECSPLLLMGYETPQKLYEVRIKDGQEYTPQEKQIIATYRRLDAYRKALADGMMQALADKEETSPGSQESKA